MPGQAHPGVVLQAAAVAAAATLVVLAAWTAPGAAKKPASPCAPTGLAAEPQGAVIHLTWDDQAGATGYRIYKVPSQPAPGPAILVAAPANETIDTQVEQGVSYAYRITAEVGGVETPDCGAVTVTASSEPCAPMAQGDHLGDSVRITWTGVVLADEYRVYRTIGDDLGFRLVSTVASDSQAYEGPLGQHEAASYQVRAVIDGRERPACNTVVISTVSVPFLEGVVPWTLAGAGLLAAGWVLARRRA